MSRFSPISRVLTQQIRSPVIYRRTFASTLSRNIEVSSAFISRITDAEKKITGSDNPVANGPTAMAQKHVGKQLDQNVISDITAGEKTITGEEGPTAGGPTAVAQSILTKGMDESQGTSTSNSDIRTGSGVLDSETISKITDAEKKITGKEGPVKGGPTAQAQKHVGEDINKVDVLRDITEGEKKITNEGRPVPGGPNAVAQSEGSKSG